MDSFKLINDFLTFNGRLEKKPFIRRYLIVFLLTYALMTIGRAINMPLLVAASSVFVIPQMSLAVRRCHDIGLSSQLAENSSGSRRAYYSACFTRFPRFPLLGQKRPLPQPVRLI